MELHGNTEKKNPWCPRNLNIRHTEITKAMENVDNTKTSQLKYTYTEHLHIHTQTYTNTVFLNKF